MSRAIYTQKELDEAVYSAVTCSKINDALSLSRYSGSRSDGAREILRSANIKPGEIRAVIDDLDDRQKLIDLIKP